MSDEQVDRVIEFLRTCGVGNIEEGIAFLFDMDWSGSLNPQESMAIQKTAQENFRENLRRCISGRQ